MAQCTAKSKRSTKQCLKWAVRGKSVCRMHGAASRGPKTASGKERSRQAAYRHGNHTKDAKALHQEVMAAIRQCKDILRSVAR